MLRLIGLLGALLLAGAVQARVDVKPVTHKAAGLVLVARLSEEIAPGDYERLIAGLRANPGRFARRIALLDSLGGSASEAMRMGRLLRESGFEVLVPQAALCQGSCIYLLAAGTKRTVHGAVGLHRPYFAGGDSQRSARLYARYDPKKYFKEMGVKPDLFADMNKIDPSRPRVLSQSELKGYGLN